MQCLEQEPFCSNPLFHRSTFNLAGQPQLIRKWILFCINRRVRVRWFRLSLFLGHLIPRFLNRTITVCRFHSRIQQVSPLLQHKCSTSATQLDRSRPPRAAIPRMVRARCSHGPPRADDGLENPCSTNLSAKSRRGAVHHASGSFTQGGGGSVLRRLWSCSFPMVIPIIRAILSATPPTARSIVAP